MYVKALIKPSHWVTTFSLIIPLVTFTHAQTQGTRVFKVTNSCYKCGSGLRCDLSYLMQNLCPLFEHVSPGGRCNVLQYSSNGFRLLQITYIWKTKYNFKNSNEKVDVVKNTIRKKGRKKHQTPNNLTRCNTLHTWSVHTLQQVIISLYLQQGSSWCKRLA